MSRPDVLVTDGACSGNGTADARGGWAAIVTRPDAPELVLTGGELATTNNRMELTAVVEGLRALPDGRDVELVTDSSYVANALRLGWLRSWQRRGWRTTDRKPVANRDLWEALLAQLARHRMVTPTLVRGHAGHEANERADRLAQEAATRVATAASPAPSPRPPEPAATDGGDDAPEIQLRLGLFD